MKESLLKVLNEKDDVIKKLNDKVNELERTSPNMGANQTLNREQTETPRDIKRKSVVEGYFKKLKL